MGDGRESGLGPGDHAGSRQAGQVAHPVVYAVREVTTPGTVVYRQERLPSREKAMDRKGAEPNRRKGSLRAGPD